MTQRAEDIEKYGHDTFALEENLKNGIVKVRFVKKNGDMRTIYATQMEEYIPAKEAGSEPKSNAKPRKPNPDVYVVVDVVANGWRSMRKDSVRWWVPNLSFDEVSAELKEEQDEKT